MRPDSVGYVSAGKMGVVFFCHARVGVTELLGDDAHRHAPHGSTWNETGGMIFARPQDCSMGRSWCDLPHRPPSARVKMGSVPILPTVSATKCCCPSSESTT